MLSQTFEPKITPDQSCPCLLKPSAWISKQNICPSPFSPHLKPLEFTPSALSIRTTCNTWSQTMRASEEGTFLKPQAWPPQIPEDSGALLVLQWNPGQNTRSSFPHGLTWLHIIIWQQEVQSSQNVVYRGVCWKHEADGRQTQAGEWVTLRGLDVHRHCATYLPQKLV